MKEKFVQMAVKNFEEGYSCSQSVVKAGIDMGLCSDVLFNVSISFSGGMGSGCLCGAISGAQMIVGALFGSSKPESMKLASEIISEFKKRNAVTCCKVLTKDFKDFHSPERRAHCVKMVKDASEILYDVALSKVKVEK